MLATQTRQTYYAVEHKVALGCKEPWCRKIYTQEEISSPQIQQYIANHKYCENYLEVYPIEFGYWTKCEVFDAKRFAGWTPEYSVANSGFVLEADLDMMNPYRSWSKATGPAEEDTSKKKDDAYHIVKHLENLELDKIQYLVFRTARRLATKNFVPIAQWDHIEFWRKGTPQRIKDSIQNDQA